MPGGIEADDEERVLVAEREQRVERHHESTLGRSASPVARDELQLVPQRVVELARAEHAGDEAGVLQPVHGLANLADRCGRRARTSPSRRRLRRRGRARAARAPCTAAARARTRPGSRCASRARARTRRTRRSASSQALARADRVARDDRDAADDPIGEEGGLVGGEEVRLVARAGRTARACRLPTRARGHVRAARSCSSWTTRCRHGASQPATTPGGRGDAEQQQRDAGTSRRTGRRSAATPCTFRRNEAVERLARRERAA